MITITDQLLNEVLNLIPDGVNMTDEQRNKVAEKLEQMNKKNVIDNHPYEISTIMKHGEEYFLTYVFDDTKKNNRRQISAKTMPNLENKIYNDYLKKQVRTFESVFEEWYKTDYKKKVSKTTYPRTKTDYNRFLKDTKFGKKSIPKISTLDVEDFIHTAIIDFELKEQGFKNLKSLLNGVFKYAKKKKYITENPIDLAEFSTTNIVKLKNSIKKMLFSQMKNVI